MDDSDIEIKLENNEGNENSEHSSRHSKELESLPGMSSLLPAPYNDRQKKALPIPPN